MGVIKSSVLLFIISILIISYISIRTLKILNILMFNDTEIGFFISIIIIFFLLYTYYFFFYVRLLSHHIESSINILTEIIKANNLNQNEHLISEINELKSSVIKLQKILPIILLVFPPSLIYIIYYINNRFRNHLIHEYKTIYLISYALNERITFLGGDLPDIKRFTEFTMLSLITFGVYLAYQWYKFSRNLDDHLKTYNEWSRFYKRL